MWRRGASVAVDGRQPSERAEPGAAGSRGQREAGEGLSIVLWFKSRNIIYEISVSDDPSQIIKCYYLIKCYHILFYFEGNNLYFRYMKMSFPPSDTQRLSGRTTEGMDFGVRNTYKMLSDFTCMIDTMRTIQKSLRFLFHEILLSAIEHLFSYSQMCCLTCENWLNDVTG